MTTIDEIEKAIEHLPAPQVEELARWLEAYRAQRCSTTSTEKWLGQARGAARPGATTDEIMTLTRGEQ